MNKTKTVLIVILITLTGILLTAGAIFPHVFIKSTVHLWINISLLFFFAIELTTILIIFKPDKNANTHQSVNIFMGLKAGKILLSLCFITIYLLVIKIETKRFLTVFIILYLIFLILETVFLLKRQKFSNKIK